MPFTRVDLLKGKSADYRKTIAGVVYDGLLKIMGAPEGDRFTIIQEHDKENFIYEKNFLKMEHSDDLVFVQLYTTVGNTTEQKRAFFKHMADELHRLLGLRREDVFVDIVILAKENWSFGNGEPWI